jgi:hypothetical protein
MKTVKNDSRLFEKKGYKMAMYKICGRMDDNGEW